MPATNRQAVVRNIVWEQGATWTDGFVWCQGVLDPDTGEYTAGPPYDTTGAVARMQVRKKQGDPILAEFRSDGEAPEITLGGTNGRFDFLVPDSKMDLITAKSAVYDLEVRYTTPPRLYRVSKGSITTDANITQDPDDPVVT